MNLSDLNPLKKMVIFGYIATGEPWTKQDDFVKNKYLNCKLNLKRLR